MLLQQQQQQQQLQLLLLLIIIIIIIIIFLHGLGRLTCSVIDALPSFPGRTRSLRPRGL